MNKEIIENHKMYLERKNFYLEFGYDVDKERNFILEKAMPIFGKIAEAGTGKGYFAVALAKQGHSFTSFDISQEDMQLAKLNLEYFGLDKYADLRIENAEHTSFSDGSFDTVFSVNTLHHLKNPYKVMDELIRILSQNGKLVLSDFTEEGFKIMDKIHAAEGKTHEIGNASISDIESYLTKKSFSIKRAKSISQYVLIAGKEPS